MNRADIALALAVSFVFIAAGMIISNVSRSLGRAEVIRDAAEGRVVQMKEARERHDEIEALPDGDLLDRLGRWVMR